MLGAVMSADQFQQAEGAVLVSDINNTMQNSKTAISTATTAINTATQIANQIRNLTPMSSDGLLNHYLGVSQQLSDVVGVWKGYNGVMSAATSAEQSWNNTFKGIDSFFDGGTSTLTGRTMDSQTTLRALEQTYKDNMKMSKQISDSQKSNEALQNSLNRVANANGAKEVGQAAAQVNSLGVQELIKGNQQLSNFVAADAAAKQAEIMEKAKALADNQKATVDYTTAVDKQIAAVKADTRNAAEKQGEDQEYCNFLRSRGVLK